MAWSQLAWAARQLGRRWVLVAIVLMSTALFYAEDVAVEPSRLFLVLPILALSALLEMLFVNDALARKEAQPNGLWRAPLVVGFFWRWLVLALFHILPTLLAAALLIVGLADYPEVAAGRIMTAVDAASWWLGYALLGGVLPAFLSGRSGKFKDAFARPGFVRRLRLLAPAALIYLFATLISGEALDSETGWLGGLAMPLLPDAALVNVGTSLLLLLVSAMVARVLTDELLDYEKINAATAEVFE